MSFTDVFSISFVLPTHTASLPQQRFHESDLKKTLQIHFNSFLAEKKNELCVCDHLKKFAGGLCYCNISIWADAYFYHTWHAALAHLGP